MESCERGYGYFKAVEGSRQERNTNNCNRAVRNAGLMLAVSLKAPEPVHGAQWDQQTMSGACSKAGAPH